MPDDVSRTEIAPARNVKRIGGLDDLPGGGQVMVRDNLAYFGHMSPPYDTTIVDVSDPRKPKVVAEIPMDGVAPAIGNAVCDAVGVDIDDNPITPEKVWRQLSA